MRAVIANLLWELRYSARSLSRTPALTIALVLTIALGIASNVSVEGFVRGLLAQQDAFPPDALISISRLLRSAAIAVFVIACANVAAFLLARATARTRETAVRVAIGARRPHLIGQVLAESVLISSAGAAAGAVLAYWIGRIVPAMLFDQDAEKMHFAVDPAGAAVIAIACAVVTIVCGLLPLIETRDDPNAIMQRENSGPSRASLRVGAGLVIVQMAACTLLIISAGLLLAGYRAALLTSTGRRLANAAIASVEALQMSSKSQTTTAGQNYLENIEAAARELIAPRSIAWIGNVPGDRPVLRSFEFEDAHLALRDVILERRLFNKTTAQSIVLPPVEGRLFGTYDSGPCGGVVLSVEAARAISTERVIGRSIETPSGWSEVVGVARLIGPPKPIVFHYAPDSDETASAPELYRVPQISEARRTDVAVTIVSRNYFDLAGLRMIAGKSFSEARDACRAAIVNEQAADLYFNGDAVGGAIIDGIGLRTSIIGVVASAKWRATQNPPLPTIYLPVGQDFQPQMTMIMETDGVGSAALRELHRRIALIPGGKEKSIKVMTLDRHMSRTALAPERITTVLVGASAMIALALGMLGLYGVMSDAARRRQREFALRIALGAQGGHVMRQVMNEGARLVAIGTIAGLAASAVIAQWIAQVSPTTEGSSPVIWIMAPIALAAAVGLASVLPARKAIASDPLMIMRTE